MQKTQFEWKNHKGKRETCNRNRNSRLYGGVILWTVQMEACDSGTTIRILTVAAYSYPPMTVFTVLGLRDVPMVNSCHHLLDVESNRIRKRGRKEPERANMELIHLRVKRGPTVYASYGEGGQVRMNHRGPCANLSVSLIVCSYVHQSSSKSNYKYKYKYKYNYKYNYKSNYKYKYKYKYKSSSSNGLREGTVDVMMKKDTV